MYLTFTNLAIIASLSSAVTSPISGTSIQPTNTQLLSKDELVQIISNEQQANIKFDDVELSVPNLTVDNTVLIVKTLRAPKKNAASNANTKALGDDE